MSALPGLGFTNPCPHSYLVAHTLGRRMLYPGSVYLLQKALMPVLLQGQARLVEEVRLLTAACPAPGVWPPPLTTWSFRLPYSV